MGVLETGVLVLNKSYLPVRVTTVKRAITLLYEGVAKAVDNQYVVYDFKDWAELKAEYGDDVIGSVTKLIRVPRVILLLAYNQIPRKHVRFSRLNIFARDNNTCQYCGKEFPRAELNIDHVVPRANGGISVWENVVCSCFECNKKKGQNTPEQAGMKLIKKPKKPEWTPYSLFSKKSFVYKEWVPFLNIIDASYWNTELEK